MTEILTSVLTKEPKPPSEFNPKISAALEHIINKSLTKKKEERYQTAKDLLIDLRKLQWRMEFEAELNRSSAPDKQSEDTLRISEVDVTEIISNVQPNNLSAEFPPIIGREKEIAEIKSLLKRQNVRLVTLTGIGGAGKTSLAKAVARRILADFADGVFFIELSAITSTELVAPTIAQSLDVKEAGGKSVFEVLKDYLRDKQILLVIDNFEQIVNAAPQIAELISAADKLKVLITSRVLLRLTAEREFVVPPLSMPDGSKQISVDELFKYEAIKLFIERAQNIKPSFDLQPDNAPTVAKICERLEGLPLAIELAAARVKLLSPQSILAKLENRLKLLTGGARDLPARQQTMRGAVEWSYDLLTNEEKCLFRHLAVFAGGFMLEAAEAVVSCQLSVVCEGEIYEQKTIEIEPLTIDTLDGITSLVDKSLLNSKEQNGGEVRFRMLEVVREYALELSGMSGEAEAMRRSHAEYFLAFAEEAEPHLQAANAVEWLNRLEEEHDNLRAALRWLLENDVQKAARLAASIRMLWTLHSHLTEGCGWLEAALERGKNVIPSEVRFELLNGLGLAMRQKGDYETAREIYEEALTAGKMADNLRQIAHSHRSLGLVVFQQGDFTAARKFLEEGLAISRQIDDRAGIAIALNFLGDLLRNESNDAAARLIFEESLAISRQLGNKEVIICNLLNLGFVAFGEKDFITAKSHFAEALSTAQELGYKILIACSLDGFAALAVEQGETETAVKLASAAETFRESIGYEIERVDRRFREAYLSKIKAKMSEEDFKKANEQGQLIKLEQAITLILDLKRVLQ
jgi:predicted ATPase